MVNNSKVFKLLM